MSNNLETDLKNGFTECTRGELEEYCEIFGIQHNEGHKDETLATWLVERVDRMKDVIELNRDEDGQILEANDPTEAPPVSDDGFPNPFPTVKPIELISTGLWGGKRRDIELFRDPRIKNQAPLMVKWDRSEIYIPYGANPESANGGWAIPYPHFNILKNAVAAQIHCEQKTEHGRTFIKKEREEHMSFPFNDKGVTPGTENLPESLAEYYRAKGHAWLTAQSARRLHMVYSMLGYPIRQGWEYEDELEFLEERFGFREAMVM